jgi:hypothetical protein
VLKASNAESLSDKILDITHCHRRENNLRSGSYLDKETTDEMRERKEGMNE